MSEIQKCPNLVWGGGGRHFSKMSEIQKYPKGRRGGGVNPNWDIVPKFLDFLFWRLPLFKLTAAEKKLSQVGVGVIKSTATKK